HRGRRRGQSGVLLLVLAHEPHAPRAQLGIDLLRHAVHPLGLKQQRHQTRPDSSLPPRVATAILIAAHARSASGCKLVAAPSRRLEYRSITVARYTFPAAVGISVMSPTHRVFGRSAVKSRLSRSGNFGFVLSWVVNPLRRLIF